MKMCVQKFMATVHVEWLLELKTSGPFLRDDPPSLISWTRHHGGCCDRPMTRCKRAGIRGMLTLTVGKGHTICDFH